MSATASGPNFLSRSTYQRYFLNTSTGVNPLPRCSRCGARGEGAEVAREREPEEAEALPFRQPQARPPQRRRRRRSHSHRHSPRLSPLLAAAPSLRARPYLGHRGRELGAPVGQVLAQALNQLLVAVHLHAHAHTHARTHSTDTAAEGSGGCAEEQGWHTTAGAIANTQPGCRRPELSKRTARSACATPPPPSRAFPRPAAPTYPRARPCPRAHTVRRRCASTVFDLSQVRYTATAKVAPSSAAAPNARPLRVAGAVSSARASAA
jgi:hypothetical protein